MGRRIDQQALFRGLALLGIGLVDFQVATRGRSFSEVKKQFDGLKLRIRKAYKEAALEHHPDRGGDEETMKLLNSTMEIVDVMELAPPPPPRPIVRIVHIRQHGGGINFTNTGTGTGTYTGAW